MSTDVLVQAVVSGLLMGLIYALVAVGLSLIFGLMEIVNFAHGEFLMLAMFASFWFWVLGLDPLISLPLVVIILGLSGLVVHYGIIRRLRPLASMRWASTAPAGFSIGTIVRAKAFLWNTMFCA